MTDLPVPKRDPLTRLHIIAYLDWQREGAQPFELARAELLDTLARLTRAMQSESGDTPILKHFLLGGQTILLEDLAAVRPKLVALLAIYNAGGRLSIGPWYVQTDNTLVSGEALLRNLLIGREDALRQGLKWTTVAYMPNSCQHTAQLPQILRGFGIDAAFLCVGRPVLPLPFRWIAPDGSELLVMNYRSQADPATAIRIQREAQPDGPFLWLHPADTAAEVMPNFSAQVDTPVVQSTLSDFVQALREAFPDGMRPSVSGLLALQPTASHSGRFSARMPLKQRNAALEAHLTHYAERALTVALTHGNYPYPENGQALLDYAWRKLITTQSQPVITGACSDIVVDALQMRYRQVEEVTERLIQTALQALPTAAEAVAEETYLLVWNPHSITTTQVVEARLKLPEGMYPDGLLSPEGEEVQFSMEDEDSISFRAQVPPVGYAAYTLRLTSERLDPIHLKKTRQQATIGSTSGEQLTLANGVLTWIHGDYTYTDLLSFYDGGDAGDTTQYRAPETDLIVEASVTNSVEVEATATYERLIVRHRMRLAPNLQKDKRERGIRMFEMTTTATCYEGIPGIHFRTSFSNTSADHRLRAHIRSGMRPTHLFSDAPFALLRQDVGTAIKAGVQGMHSLVALRDPHRMLAVITRGLPEYEPTKVDGQLTLELTLLRSVGALDADGKQPMPGAQHLHDVSAEFMLLTLPFEDTTTLLHAAQAYRAPLLARQTSIKPAAPTSSYLTIDDPRILLTALKPPQEGAGWLVRLLNPTDKAVETTLAPRGKLRTARLVTLAEQPQAPLELHKNTVRVTLEPQQIVTVRLEFEREG